jgi:ATP/maltotriose-dependent transcriptional regulator MalT/DNA-binding SARP family transcriptional activator
MITKVLLPRKQPGLLHRQRLVNFVHEHIDRKLILVSASAGYGKTSLLVDFAHDTDLPVCWYSVDEADRDYRVFLEYLMASIRQQFPDFGSRTESALSTTAKANGQLKTLVSALVNDIHDLPDYFVVVIDDYHFVDESHEVNVLLDDLLRYLPENCHLIISSRTLPQLTFSRLIARQESFGLGTPQLRFTAAEIQILLKQAYNLDISDEQAEELACESEGWITGILLTTHTIWKGLVRSMVQARGAGGQMYDYLANDVLGQQPLEIQRFLKDSSILREMSPALCDALLDSHDSLETLRLIEKRNLFISRLEGDELWYRYHHLFQKFLQDRLRLEEPGRFNALHRRAAEVFQRMGNHEEAIRHYMQARAYAETVEVVQQVAEATFNAGRWETLAGWIDALPDEITRSHPDLPWFRARVYTQVGQLSQALTWFDLARAGFQRRGDRAGVGQVLVRRATALRFAGRVEEAIKDCESVISDLDGHHSSIVAIAHRNLGICYGMQGDHQKCAAELEKALQLYEQCGDEDEVAWTRHDLSVVHWRMGNLARADLELERAIEYLRRAGKAEGLAAALNNSGFRQHCRGRYNEALETLEEALATARKAGYVRVEAHALANLGDVHRDLGDLRQALDLYQKALRVAHQADEAVVEIYALNGMSEAHRLAGELDKAWEMARASLAASQTQQLSFHVGVAQRSLGVICSERGEAQKALRWLEKARQRMEQSETKQELARVHFHLAQAHFLLKEFQSARRHLLQLLSLIDELGYDQFIAVEARQARPLIQYAASRRLGGDRFARLMEKVEEALTKGEISPPQATAVSPSFPQLEIHAMGTPQVLKDGTPVGKGEWQTAAAEELFFYLLAHPDGQPREQITDVFWPDLSPARAKSTFHSTVYRLRRATHMEILAFDRGSGIYRLDHEMHYWYDVEEFEKLLKAAPERSESRVKALRQAIALYRGDYMEGSYSDWCLTKRRILEEQYLDALSELAHWYMNEGSYDQALELCEKALQKDNYREEMYRLMMRGYSLLGQPSRVIQVYQRCSTVLAEELGIEPAAETVALYQQLMAEQ